jgi:hypothetical protein
MPLLVQVCHSPDTGKEALDERLRKLKWAMKPTTLEAQLRLCGDVVLKRLGGKNAVGLDAVEEILRWEAKARALVSLHKQRKYVKALNASEGGSSARCIVPRATNGIMCWCLTW